jgi:hypothetical protein
MCPLLQLLLLSLNALLEFLLQLKLLLLLLLLPLVVVPVPVVAHPLSLGNILALILTTGGGVLP